jgi:hypothetical protein
MTGQQAFEQLVAFSDRYADDRKKISQEDFDIWEKDVIWDCLHGIRYGQSFCNRFGISDNLLYYTTWPPEQMTDYIRKHYVERS